MTTPVLKIGAVIVRAHDKAVLIMQPIPKEENEIPAYVLPRGSRQYAVVVNGESEWHDARDAATGLKHEQSLETFYRGLEREIEEEAGITREQLAKAQVIEMGAMDFKSRTKGIYPIHWFIVVPDEATVKAISRSTPVDALSVRWAKFEAIIKLDDVGKFSTGYIPVIAEALKRLG
jgi:hypothetical protein